MNVAPMKAYYLRCARHHRGIAMNALPRVKVPGTWHAMTFKIHMKKARDFVKCAKYVQEAG